ncbi:MAG: lipase secretion chaperone [Desulfosudaceae bacterium]
MFRKITAAAGLLLLVGLLALFLRQSDPDKPEYIFDKTTGPSLGQVKETPDLPAGMKTGEADAAAASRAETAEKIEEGSALRDLFSEMIVGSGMTLEYFSHLGHEFRQAESREAHLAAVRESIFARFPAEEARRLYDNYIAYVDCEAGVADLIADFGPVSSAEEGLALLREIQEYRREVLGEDLADRLYGGLVKEKEYSLRRAAIVNDGSLYAEEKQERLRQLDQDMWGEETADTLRADDPYGRYQEALRLHEKDLGQAVSAAERQDRVRSLRDRYFPPETVKKLEDLESRQQAEQEKEMDYYEKKRQIAENPDLSAEEKDGQVERLRQDMFGDQAAAMKRRDAIREAKQSLVQEHQESERRQSAPDRSPMGEDQ